ncbi:hypothetical protein [Pseudoalteromonas sp. 2CM32C]|nr:hypothetical protein [Pseudoalteromonas sp. 2CM32C]
MQGNARQGKAMQGKARQGKAIIIFKGQVEGQILTSDIKIFD